MSITFYDPATFTSRESLGYLLKMAHAQMHVFGDRLFAQQDISFVQWIALMKLHERSLQSASELCRAMSHDNGAITRMLDQLEARGYVERQRSQRDRRVVELRLTAEGRAKLDELRPQVVAMLNAALNAAGFSLEEFNELSRLLAKLLGSLQAANAAPGDAS